MSKIKILYAEDDPEWQDLLLEIISPENYQIEFVSSYDEAIKKLSRSTFHVGLLDKKLDMDDPDNEDGLRIAEFISKLNEGTKIVIWTSHGTIENARIAFRNFDVVDFIEKGETIEIRESIESASNEALLAFEPLSRFQNDILDSVKGEVLDELLEYLPSLIGHTSPYEKLELFSKDLLHFTRPLLPSKQKPILLSEFQNPIIQIRFWSKMLELPIGVWLGMDYDVKNARSEIEAEKRAGLGLGPIIHDLYHPLSNYGPPTNYGGIVFELVNTDFEEFEHLNFL